MNRFKNQILLVAGFAVLAGLISGITAAPAIAAAVKAALIKNVDERGRVPYFVKLSCSVPGTTNICTNTAAAIPANKRFVVEHINGHFQVPNNTSLFDVEIAAEDFNHFAPRFFVALGTLNNYTLNEPARMYYGPTTTPSLFITLLGNPAGSASTEVLLYGYLVDLDI